MDSDGTCDGEVCSSSTRLLELSQSSGVISLPSGHKLDDITVTSDLSDSEMKSEDTVLCSSANQVLRENQQCSEREDASRLTTVVSDDVKSYEPLCFNASTVSHRKSKYSSPNVQNVTSEHEQLSKHLSSVGLNNAGGDFPKKVIFDGAEHKETVVQHRPLPTDSRGILGRHSVSLDDIKVALQRNCSFLSDRDLVNDLLQSLDDKIGQNCKTGSVFQSSHDYLSSFVTPNKDPGPSHEKTSCPSLGIIRLTDPVSDESNVGLYHTTSEPDIDSSVVNSIPATSNACCNSSQRLLTIDAHNCTTEGLVSAQTHFDPENEHKHTKSSNQQSTSNATKSSLSHRLAFEVSEGKSRGVGSSEHHVKFQQTPVEDVSQTNVISSSSQASNHQPSGEQPASFEEYSKILRQVGLLRWRLVGWEDIRASPPDDTQSALQFIHHLLHTVQVHQLEKKHLEDELSATKMELANFTRESYIQHELYKQREERLLNADVELGSLQEGWVAIQEATEKEMMRLTSQCHQLVKERESLCEEVRTLKKDVGKLRQTVRDYENLKIALEKTQEEFTTSRKKMDEIAQENFKLCQCLQEKQRALQALEQVKFPQVEQELECARGKVAKLEESQEKLLLTKAHIEGDLALLQDQHRILLKKVVQEEAAKEAALKEKVSLLDQVKNLSDKQMVISDVHHHYQGQVEQLMAKKSQALQVQVRQLEEKMTKNLEQRLNSQRQSHHQACLNMQKGHENKIQELTSSHGTQMQELQQQLKAVKEENKRLQEQRCGIIAAVSSILGLHQKDLPINELPPVIQKSTDDSSNSRSASCPLQGKSSKNGSHPTRKASNTVPQLGLQSSSSSDSGASIFQEGRQTVRHLGAGTEFRGKGRRVIESSLEFENEGAIVPSSPKSENVAWFLRSEHDTNNRHEHRRNSRSLPDLSGESDVKSPAENVKIEGAAADKSYEMDSDHKNYRQETLWHCKETCRTLNKNPGQGDRENVPPLFTKHVYKASEIIQASDHSDEDGREIEALKELQVDQEMACILEQLRMKMKTSSKLATSQDSSPDQEPASITLQKLNKVSTLLSQYVTQS